MNKSLNFVDYVIGACNLQYLSTTSITKFEGELRLGVKYME